jgi:hypothetical protein
MADWQAAIKKEKLKRLDARKKAFEEAKRKRKAEAKN